MKNWKIYYRGYFGSVVSTGRLSKRKAKSLFKKVESAFALEKINGKFKRIIFKENI